MNNSDREELYRKELIARTQARLKYAQQIIRDTPAEAPMIRYRWDGAQTRIEIDGIEIFTAAKSCPLAWETACGLSADALAHNENMPPQLKSFVIAMLRGEIKRPTRKRGRPDADWRRDSEIISALRSLEAAGIPPTTRDYKGSGCEIVGDALGLSPRAVSKVWERRGEITTVPFYGASIVEEPPGSS